MLYYQGLYSKWFLHYIIIKVNQIIQYKIIIIIIIVHVHQPRRFEENILNGNEISGVYLLTVRLKIISYVLLVQLSYSKQRYMF